LPFCPTEKRASTVSKNAVVAAAKPGCLCAQQHDVPIPQTALESQAMMRHLVFCHECASIGEAAAFMARARVRRLPVVARDRELVGIVSLADMPVSLMPAGTLRPLWRG
jgi:CBS domain-containing protein